MTAPSSSSIDCWRGAFTRDRFPGSCRGKFRTTDVKAKLRDAVLGLTDPRLIRQDQLSSTEPRR